MSRVRQELLELEGWNGIWRRRKTSELATEAGARTHGQRKWGLPCATTFSVAQKLSHDVLRFITHELWPSWGNCRPLPTQSVQQVRENTCLSPRTEKRRLSHQSEAHVVTMHGMVAKANKMRFPRRDCQFLLQGHRPGMGILTGL